MTVATYEATDDIMDVAVALGVSTPTSPLTRRPLLPLTERREVAADETGGLDVLIATLREKTDAVAVLTRPRPPTSPPLPRVRAAVRRLAARAARALETARRAAAWVTSELPSPASVVSTWRAYRSYKPGRHRVRTTWYGAQRSTAQRTGAAHVVRELRRERQPRDQEPALPELWVGHLARYIESVRGYHEALHPTTRHRFICS